MGKKTQDIRTTADSAVQHAGGGHPHLPRDSRNGSDSRAGSTRTPATQNDLQHGGTAAGTQDWEEDLHRDDLAGRNTGRTGQHPEKGARTAYDVKSVHRHLASLTDDELQRIPIMPPGSRLEQGATYLDLRHPERGEMTAMGGQTADDGHAYAPKKEVDPYLWNRLLGVDDPERLGNQRGG